MGRPKSFYTEIPSLRDVSPDLIYVLQEMLKFWPVERWSIKKVLEHPIMLEQAESAEVNESEYRMRPPQVNLDFDFTAKDFPLDKYRSRIVDLAIQFRNKEPKVKKITNAPRAKESGKSEKEAEQAAKGDFGNARRSGFESSRDVKI